MTASDTSLRRFTAADLAGGLYDVEAVFAKGQDLADKVRPARPGDA
jgi:hypothetical protein